MRKVMGALVALLLVAGLMWAQSLGELARQARAKRPRKTSSKVYTNDNIPRAGAAISIMGSGAAPTAAQAEGQAAAAAEGAAGEEGEEECDEECWRGKFAEQREKIRQAERELNILQREFNLARVQYYQDPNQAVREQYSANTAGGQELQDIQNRIQEKQQEVQQFQQELSALEDDLRRAGGKPAWAREQ